MTTRQINGFTKTCREAADALGKEFSTCFGYVGRSVRKLEGIDKLFKLILPIGDLFVYTAGPCVPFLAVRGPLKGFNDFVNASYIVSRAKEFTDKNDLKKMRDDWKELAKKVTLAAANVLQTIKFLDTIKLIDLGQIASKTVKLPILNITSTLSPIMMVADGLIVISSIFSLSQQPEALEKGTRHLELAKRDRLKEDKWKVKLDTVKCLKMPDSMARDKKLARLRDEYKVKRFDIMRPTNHWGVVEATIDRDWNNFVAKANSDLTNRHSSPIRRWEKRAEMWTAANEVHSNTRKRAWITIANDTAKIAIISFATIALTLFGVTSAPVMIPFYILAIATGTIGLCKFLFDDKYKENEEIMKEAFKLSEKDAGKAKDVHPAWKQGFGKGSVEASDTSSSTSGCCPCGA